MSLPELMIRRHVLAVMISVIIVLFGVIAEREVGVDRLPNIDFPVINVTVAMPGADPEIIDTSVTEVIERAVNTVPGIDEVNSTTVPGNSVVNITFDLEKDIDVAFNEVTARVNEAVQDLPEDAEAPVVDKVEFDAQPIMWIALQGDRTLQDLNRTARNDIRPQLESLSGVGEVLIGGRRERNIRVEVDPDRLAAHNVTVPELLAALEEEHVQLPGGFLVGSGTEQLLKLDLEYHHPLEMEGMVIASHGGELVKLRDVAEVVDGLEDQRSLARFKGEQSVGLGIVKVSGTNTVEIIENVKERLDSTIRPELPPGLEMTIASDESVFILEQIDALYLTIGLGILFAALVILFFLRNLRSTIIVSLSIPVSLMAAVATLFFFGYTLNSFTMLGLLLLIGIVVDDAIVVLENIYRRREQLGEDSMTGAINGSNEVFFAVVASSLALIAIFGAVLFLEAVIGRFFESFAVVIAFGILASSIVALTLVPMLASRFLRVQQEHGLVYRSLERLFGWMDNGYRWVLGGVLKARWIVLGLVVAFMAGTVFLVRADMSFEFFPEEDVGEFLVIFETPLGSSIEYTDSRLDIIEDRLAEVDEIDRYFTAIALGDQGQVNSGLGFVRLVPREERDVSQQEITQRLIPELGTIPGVRAFATDVPLIGGQRGEPLQFSVTGPDLDGVGEQADAFFQRLQETPGMGSVDMELDLELPELGLQVDRERARALGIPSSEVARSINVLAGGLDIARYNDEPGDGQRYDVRVKGREGAFTAPEDLRRIHLRSAGGEMIRLDTIASFQEQLGPAAINRFNLQYAANFFVNPDVPLGEAIDRLDEIAEEELPLGYSVNLTGQARELGRTADAVMFVLFLSIALVYIVLASQFNSFVQPLIIMAAQPVALVGGTMALWIGGFTLNAYSMIGLLLLMGLVTKNGILLVDLTNQYREKQGMGVNEALASACPIRLRPVLMTSLTLILAMVPALLGLGAGAETNAPMAAAIVGGMLVSMLITLVAIPAAYSLIEGFKVRRLGMERKTSKAEYT